MTLEDTHSPGFFNRLSATADVEFHIDVVEVFFYSLWRNEKPDSDFLILQPLSQQVQDFQLAVR